MRVLLFGPSGSGKTYLSKELRKLGLNAVDADSLDDLHSWYNGAGDRVEYPQNADEEFFDTHSFLWNKDYLKDYLHKYSNLFLLGAAGNVFDLIDLFDKVYYLDVSEDLQYARLMHESRENPMGSTEYQRQNAIAWGKELREKARNFKISFIDASLSPKEIYTILQKDE